jgi:hypothetical protein
MNKLSNLELAEEVAERRADSALKYLNGWIYEINGYSVELWQQDDTDGAVYNSKYEDLLSIKLDAIVRLALYYKIKLIKNVMTTLDYINIELIKYTLKLDVIHYKNFWLEHANLTPAGFAKAASGHIKHSYGLNIG